MRRPWEEHGGPDDETLRRLVEEGWTDRQIGEKYGVTRQTVAYWRMKAGIHRPGKKPTRHKDMLPWTVTAYDNGDPLAYRLREYDTIRKGGDVKPEVRRRVQRFVADLAELDAVLDYNRDEGWLTRRRDPRLDDPDDIIRRPPAA